MTLPLGRLAALGLGLAALALPATAAADTVTENYSVPGTYTLTIPQYTTSVNVIANGAGGTDATGGGSSGTNGGAGGQGPGRDAASHPAMRAARRLTLKVAS